MLGPNKRDTSDTRSSVIRDNVRFSQRVASGLRIKRGNKDNADMSNKAGRIKMCENHEEANCRA
jgi:hypothetical protein